MDEHWPLELEEIRKEFPELSEIEVSRKAMRWTARRAFGWFCELRHAFDLANSTPGIQEMRKCKASCQPWTILMYALQRVGDPDAHQRDWVMQPELEAAYGQHEQRMAQYWKELAEYNAYHFGSQQQQRPPQQQLQQQSQIFDGRYYSGWISLGTRTYNFTIPSGKSANRAAAAATTAIYCTHNEMMQQTTTAVPSSDSLRRADEWL
ncbi:hypothetical protein BDZ45DRAFT_699902 [Acephala macrosclerotiorum]|nr:hypothetical protein BDZ45DRAFT_699902 [Acephala macrosclerotiorum]